MLLIAAPVMIHGFSEQVAISYKPVGFAQQMCHGKTQVKSRVAKMNHLMVEQDQAVIMYQDVFGAVISMHQRKAPPERGLDQLFKEWRGFRNLLGGKSIIRFEAQTFKKVAVIKDFGNLIALGITVLVDRAEQVCKLFDVVKLQIT